jgi:hypothetical protein
MSDVCWWKYKFSSHQQTSDIAEDSRKNNRARNNSKKYHPIKYLYCKREH